jgi:hypothetical protein
VLVGPLHLEEGRTGGVRGEGAEGRGGHEPREGGTGRMSFLKERSRAKPYKEPRVRVLHARLSST